MPIVSQLGVANEATYGTGVTVTRFFEFSSESIKLETGRAISEGLRSGQRVARTDRFVPYVKGAAGSLKLEPASRGFGIWLQHLLGNVSTSGPTDSAYTHLATVADLWNKSFTMQVNRPFGAAGSTNQAFTWTGGKVQKWSMECEAEGLLTLEMDLLFQNESTSVALATASYPTGTEVMSWSRASATVGGSAVPVTKWKVTVDNSLESERFFLQTNTRRAQPAESAMRSIEVEFECDWDSLTHYNRFRAETAAGTLASVLLEARSPSLIGATTYPGITITMPNVRFDEAGGTVDGPGIMMDSIKGTALTDGTANAIELRYITLDSAP